MHASKVYSLWQLAQKPVLQFGFGCEPNMSQ